MEQFDEEVWSYVRDDRFIRWVLAPNDADERYWATWVASHPGQAPLLEKARILVLELHTSQQPAIPDATLEAFYQRLNQALQEDTGTTPVITYNRSRYLLRWTAGVAAAVALSIGVYNFGFRHTPAATGTAVAVVKNITRMNNSHENQLAYLVDGSSVVLQSGASIEHPAFLQRDRREVHLKGNAFFDVAKDPSRPFTVYTDHLVIRVLGTSFGVSTAANGNTEVIVRTGKISVYRPGNLQQPLYVLKARDRVRYDVIHNSFRADAVSRNEPGLLEQPVVPVNTFTFEDAPVLDILAAMERAYGIPIHADEKTFAHCTLTTSLQAETFEDKLRIICTAINATYKISDGQVTMALEGKPCG